MASFDDAIPSARHPFPYELLRIGIAPEPEWKAARAAFLRYRGYESIGITHSTSLVGFPLIIGECTHEQFRVTMQEKDPTRAVGWGPMEQWVPDHVAKFLKLDARYVPSSELVHWFDPPLTREERMQCDTVHSLHGNKKKLWDLYAKFARARDLPVRDLEPGEDW